ncbi:MAG: acetylornithine deacetylase [Bacteroidetes bacterium GWF2_40_14]|nr:MAG: acetylornithine deacetylase [Bacteroidetes bacterium GWF2_40_14]
MKIEEKYFSDAEALLHKLVRIVSYSGEENMAAQFVFNYLSDKGTDCVKVKNNVIAYSRDFKPSRPTLMLNSHLDTVKAGSGYTFDPLNPPLSDDRILGLGSNDAGGSVVSMIETFLYFNNHPVSFNILLVLSAEEENSGKNGMDIVLKKTPEIACAIVGEPTGMRVAVAERGLLVVDAIARGKSGHAARGEGENAIYTAIEDINWIRGYKFPLISDLMGEVRATVTQIEAGVQHNVVPDACKFVIDIRPTDQYTNPQIMEILKSHMKCDLKARSLTNKSSSIHAGHPLVKTADLLEIEKYVSPTTSDWMRLSLPAIKMGPGESSRSHRSDEYIFKSEVRQGVEGYINFVKKLEL